MEDIKYKFCKACENLKPITEFHRDSTRNDGYKDKCKLCTKDKLSIPSFENKSCRMCEGCKTIKDIENFTYGNKFCKRCINNKKSMFYYANKESIIENIKVYNIKNKNYINSAKRNRYKIRSAQDSLFKLKHNIKSLVQQSFKSKGVNKNSKTIEILGCTIEEFKRHIEIQFLSWMTWKNHGFCSTNEYNCTWQLDHIIPISSAKTEEEVYLLNHWSNFQPLCSRVNTINKRDNIYPCTNLELKIIVENNQILKYE